MAGVMIAVPKSGSGKTMIGLVAFLGRLTGEDGTRLPLNARALITLTACSHNQVLDRKWEPRQAF